MHRITRTVARARFGRALLAVAAGCGIPALVANGATMYFDTNGATAGSTNSTSQQTWNSSAVDWSSDPDGLSSTSTYVDGSDAVFSAGTNAVSAYTVSTAGNKTAHSITIEEGTLTFTPSTTPPTRTLGAGGITLAATAGGNVTFNDNNGGLTFILSASQPWTDDHATANFSVTNAAGKNKIFTNSATGTVTLTAAANGAGNVSIAAPISDGTAGGNVAFTANSAGTGAVVLTGINTYTGGTTVAAGNLLLDNGGSLAHANINITAGALAGGTTGAGGALTANVTDDTAEFIALSGAGVLDLTNLNLTLNATGTQTQPEYVLANAPTGSPNILGAAFASATLPAGWSINYTGTAAHPDSIVLLDGNVAPVPEPVTLGLLSLTTLPLLLRRPRSAKSNEQPHI